MALAGVGVDIVEIARMERILERTPHFIERVFTAEERAYCEHTARPAAHYACRFAAREATLKALGTGFAGCKRYDDVSVTIDNAGRPQVVLAGPVAELAEKQGVLAIAISLSFTREMAVANAVATTAQTAPKTEEAVDPKAELARSFKEARSIIDELERVQTSDEMQASDEAGEENAPEPAAAELAPASATGPVPASASEPVATDPAPTSAPAPTTEDTESE